MMWVLDFLDEAKADLQQLDNSIFDPTMKGIRRVAANPLPQNEGGYGKPLRNQSGLNLAGLLKIKFKKSGIRVIYKLEKIGKAMKIIVVSARADEKAYKEASRRREKYGI